ncbi:sulfate reduction electron transfer complex DsrMKJOP subunit DsrM [Dehalococcoidales bacterium]|nr:sulfate reduction electron transfer complex DsrMKJOP subunit DsrM [Dehalococcoidales bacterium]
MNALYALLAVIILILIAFIGVGAVGLYSLFGIIIPYAAATIFIVGLIYRLLKWASSPVPFHIPQVGGQQKSLPWIKADNIDSPYNTAGVIARLALEVFLFRSLFKNEKVELKRSEKLVYGGNKYLWLAGLVFHWCLLIILFRHLRYFLEPVPSWVLFIQDIDGILRLFIPTLFITNVAILLALTYLFLRRVIYSQLRYISLPADYFAVLLLFSVVVSGILTRHFFKVDVVAVKELAMGVISFHPAIPEGIGLAFYIHLFLVCALLAYFPFSKLVHAPGILFSPTRNLMNNSRMVRHINPWNYPVKVHTYEEYEDENRERMKKVGLPLEKE